MVKTYIPARGDVVMLAFDPQAGSEQAGLRPAVVLSKRSYNVASGLALFCPITSVEKGYPFEVAVDKTMDDEDGKAGLHGVVLTDQIKSLDWRVRKAKFRCRLAETTFEAIMRRVNLLLQ